MSQASKLDIAFIKKHYLDLLTHEEILSLDDIDANALKLLKRKITILNIKKHYAHFLSSEEIASLDYIDEVTLRLIVNKIWNNYLTNPFNNETEIKFNYLIYTEGLWFFDSGIPSAFKDSNESQFRNIHLLNNDNILQEYTGRSGFIVRIDWTESAEIYLPIDFANSKIGQFFTTSIKVLAVFCVSIGAGSVTAEYSISEDVANHGNLLFVDLNKKRYDPKYEPLKYEFEDIAQSLICEYIFDHNISIKFRDEFYAKYQAYVLKEYHDLVAKGEYKANEFKKLIHEHIDKKENITKRAL